METAHGAHDYFSSLAGALVEPLLSLVRPERRVWLPFLAAAAAIATAAWLRRSRRPTLRAWRAFVMPRRVWLHPSALLDYKLLFARPLVQAALFAPLALPALALAVAVASRLRDLPWQPQAPGIPHGALVAIYTLSAFAADDFSRYLLHRLMHRAGFLWELHKVHHSAEVLTPFTVYRVHPIESLLYRLRGTLVTGLVGGLFMWLWPQHLAPWQVLGVDLIGFAWTALGANLRHSHVWISYGPWLERVLISPAQHQIHHDRHPERQGRNLGAALALWDWMFGTLELARRRERIRFGIDPGCANHGETVASVLVAPVLASARRLATTAGAAARAARGPGRGALVHAARGVCLVVALGLCAAAASAAPPDAGTPPDAAPPATDVAPPTGDARPPDTAPAPSGRGAEALTPPTAARPTHDPPHRVAALTVVGTREPPTLGEAHVVKSADLERQDQDDSHAVLKQVPGIYARGEDGLGLRPNIGIRGVNPDRSTKVTLMEDGVLFAPAPYSAPAAYYFPLITRMEAVRVVKGPGAIGFGPQTLGGAIDLVTRAIPGRLQAGADLAAGQYEYGKAHVHVGAAGRRLGFLVEGVHLRTAGFKHIDGGGDTGFARSEIMGKARWVPVPGARLHNEVQLKLGFSSEDSDETYLGLTDADLRADPLRRYAASRFDHMTWQRLQGELRHVLDAGGGRSVETVLYRHDLGRVWNKVNRFGGIQIAEVLQDPDGARNQLYYRLLKGEVDSTSLDETLYIGPNDRDFVAQGAQSVARLRWDGPAMRHRLELGARLHYDRIDRFHSEDGYVVRGGVLERDGGATRITSDARASSTALALHALHSATWRGLTFMPGVRFELIHTETFDRRSGTGRTGQPQRVLMPGAGLRYALAPFFDLLAGVYRGFAPGLPGQAESAPETAWNYEAGARVTDRLGRAEVTGFLGERRTWGIEVFAGRDLRLPRRWLAPVSLAYTLTRTGVRESFTSEDPGLGRIEAEFQLPYVPEHQAMLTLGLEAPWFGLDVTGGYTSSMREQAGAVPLPSDPSTDASLVLDGGARWYFVKRAHLYLHVRNVADAHDIASRRPYGARPVSPRWVQVGVKATY